MTATGGTTPPDLPVTGLIVGEGEVPLWGMASSERLRRALRRAGCVAVHHDETGVPRGLAGQPLAGLRADFVFDEALVKALVAGPPRVLVDPDSGLVVAARVEGTAPDRLAQALAEGRSPEGILPQYRPEQLSGAYNHALRKSQPPYLLRLTAASRRAVERRMFDASYKGVTDFVTKYLWPRPAQLATKLCAVAGVTPNLVTWASFALVVVAFWLFATGQFGWGLAAAWGMTFLDTVDGKLARVTLTSSRLGNLFDHGIDLIHPPFWWWAWVAGLAAVGLPLAAQQAVLAVVIGGYVLQRLQEGLFLALFKIEIHVWRRFDSLFRLITARRNPNLAILTVAWACGRPDLGLLAVAWWTLLCLGVHFCQIAQALLVRRRTTIRSWLG